MMAGKVVVVTGAAGGIGCVLVERLLKEKSIVWALDRSASALQALVERASQNGEELRVCETDVSSEQALQSAVAQITAVDKRIHVWVNNAGLSGLGDFSKMPPETFQRVLSVNIGGVVTGTRLALSHMELFGAGTIVNMGSIAGFVPAPYLTAYSASKHAVVGFTRALNEELRLKQSGVRLVLVSPGFVDTAMLNSGPDSLAFPEWLRWAVSTPEVVADAVLSALKSGQTEVVPTWNGKIMKGLHGFFPERTRRGANLLLARSFRDWILNRYTVGG